jgi:hypothetical protein
MDFSQHGEVFYFYGQALEQVKLNIFLMQMTLRVLYRGFRHLISVG